MHVRLSMILAAPLHDEDNDVLGTVDGAIIHPDRGVIEGLLVRQFRGAFPFHTKDEDACLASRDIVRIVSGVVHVRRGSVGPLSEHVRLQALLDERRWIVGQNIVTESGVKLGRCGDVQFNTTTFAVEWLFPRKFWRWRRPIPVASIIEVRQDAILVRDAQSVVPIAERESTIEEVPVLSAALG